MSTTATEARMGQGAIEQIEVPEGTGLLVITSPTEGSKQITWTHGDAESTSLAAKAFSEGQASKLLGYTVSQDGATVTRERIQGEFPETAERVVMSPQPMGG